jgi:hypothetical protein
MLNALIFLKNALKKCTNKPLVIVDGGHGMGGPLIGLDWSVGIRGLA